MKNILVTGGAGFIGSHTVVELIENGFNPILLDNFSNSERFVLKKLEQLVGRELTFYDVDCRNREDMFRIFSENNIEGVIHFAAYKAVGESMAEALKYHSNNSISMLVLLEVMTEFGVNDLVFSSSCTVYGDTNDSPVTEDSANNITTSPYGRTKVYCEQILTDVYHENESKLNSVMLRYFNPIGAHESGQIGELPLGPPNNLVPYITQTAAGIREELTVFGNDYDTKDGTCLRDYIHVIDVAKAHVSALQWLENQNHQLEAVNLGSGNGNTVLEVIKMFESVSGRQLNYKFGPRRAGDVASVYADYSKAKALFNWAPTKTLENALDDAWKWQMNLNLAKS